MTKLVNSELSLSHDVLADSVDVQVEVFLSFLKANGLRAGKKPVAELLAGKRDEVAGFYLIADDAAEGPAEGAAEGAADPAPADLAPAAPAPVAPTAGMADEKPLFPEDLVAAAIAAFAGTVVTSKPVEAAAAAKPAVTKAAKVLKAVAPAGKVKAVRKGTKIANGLEVLLSGTTAEALLAAGIGDDLVDFCNRRVTKRGYGIALDGATIRLVLPEGATSIAYSN